MTIELIGKLNIAKGGYMKPCTSGRIVIVDDMSETRCVVEDTLKFAGYTNFVSYENPLIALEEIKRNTRPAIVITDFNMPGMNGLQLLTEIENHHPEIEAVIMTGDPLQPLLADQTRFMVIGKGPGLTKKLLEFVRQTIVEA
jgi:DNA-binding NtrC family response regulator